MNVIKFHVVAESGHQNFMVLAMTADGRLWACAADWAWFEITPQEPEEDEE